MDFHRHLNVSICPVKEKRSHFLGTHQWRTSQTFDSQEIWRETIGERGRRGFSFFVRGERTAAKEKLNRPDGNSRLRSRIVSLSNAYPFPFCPCVYRSLYANNRRRVRARAIPKLLDIENGIWRMMVEGGKECLVLVPIDDFLSSSRVSSLFSDHRFEFTVSTCISPLFRLIGNQGIIGENL